MNQQEPQQKLHMYIRAIEKQRAKKENRVKEKPYRNPQISVSLDEYLKPNPNLRKTCPIIIYNTSKSNQYLKEFV